MHLHKNEYILDPLQVVVEASPGGDTELENAQTALHQPRQQKTSEMFSTADKYGV